MNYRIRIMEPRDNSIIESIIRTCLIEYGGDHEGTAWADPNLGRFSEVYSTEGNCYWVAEEEDGMVVAGVGIGGFAEDPKVCELQKMYCKKEARGTGIAKELLDTALAYAKEYYQICFLETLDNMVEAQKFYEKNGFVRTCEPIIATEHYACDVRYVKEL